MNGKHVIVGVSGSIAAYKAVMLIRQLVKQGARVTVIMTDAATRFVSPLTFSSVSGSRVARSMFEEGGNRTPRHISLAQDADVLVIAPATANIIGKISNGIADDLLSTTALSVTCPVVVAPAMNSRMYGNAAVKDNLRLLEQRGAVLVEPETGELLSGEEGTGRLADVGKIVETVRQVLSGKNDFAGDRVVVTAGPTREEIDPVRFISNRSTGKMGFEIARAARERGAKVVLISGPSCLEPPAGVEVVRVESGAEMREAILSRYDEANIIVMTAAVADFKAGEKYDEKIQKGKASLLMELEATPDILKELGKNKGNKFLAGFSLDTTGALEKAAGKMAAKNLDMVIVSDGTSSLGNVRTKMVILDAVGGSKELPESSKDVLAHLILDRITRLRRGNH